MTDEQLQRALQEISESIDKLPQSDEALSSEERKRKVVLSMKKQVLERIKDAREKNEKGQELYEIIVYGLLTSVGEKHPYLASLIRANIRWSMF